LQQETGGHIFRFLKLEKSIDLTLNRKGGDNFLLLQTENGYDLTLNEKVGD
jgi:hypothetical protein